jgi:hypothetical protein
MLTAEIAVTGAVSLSPSAMGRMHVCSGTSADYEVDLPTTLGALDAGLIIGFRMSSALTKLVTLDAGASLLTDGQRYRVLFANESCILMWTGTAWTKIAGKTIPMVCSMVPASAQTLSSNLTVIKVTLGGTPEIDVGGMADTANSRIVIRRTSKYLITGGVLYDTASGTVTGFNGAASRIHQNGSFFNTLIMYLPTNLQRPNPEIASPATLTAADYMELNAYMDCIGAFSNQSTHVSSGAFMSRLMVQELTDW